MKGNGKAAVQWKEITKSQDEFIDPKYLPLKFEVCDPSRLVRVEAEALYKHWQDRSEAGKAPLRFRKVVEEAKVERKKAVQNPAEEESSSSESSDDDEDHDFVQESDGETTVHVRYVHSPFSFKSILTRLYPSPKTKRAKNEDEEDELQSDALHENAEGESNGDKGGIEEGSPRSAGRSWQDRIGFLRSLEHAHSLKGDPFGWLVEFVAKLEVSQFCLHYQHCANDSSE